MMITVEQEVERVNHSMGPKELTQIGSHVEAIVLERAVKWFAEQRILMNGAKVRLLNRISNAG